MKLKKMLRRYYLEQVDAVTLPGNIWKVKIKSPRAESLLLNIVFHAILVGLIITAMISGQYQPSHINQQVGIIIDRYNVEKHMVDSLENLIIIIKNNRSDGGTL